MSFPNANNLTFYDSQFNNIVACKHGFRFDTLARHCAMEATHESPTAQRAPQCKPETREQVLSDIMNWVRCKESTSGPLLWFSGPAGSGKTCVQREVAVRCKDHGVLAGTYFFSTRTVGLDSEEPFIATIAHQLAESLPGLRNFIIEALEENINVFSKSLDIQLEILILKPIGKLIRTSPAPSATEANLPRTLVIDGLDECRIEERKHLLKKVLFTMATNSIFPFHIIIASRPEFDIETAFSTSPLKASTTVIGLESYDGSNDIRNYLRDELRRIGEEHPARSVIPENWPNENDINTLVSTSSSQFIFASTVVTYLDNRKKNPVRGLERILHHCHPHPTDPTNPFSNLDDLYCMILRPADENTDVGMLGNLLSVILLYDSLNPRKYNFAAEFSALTPAHLDSFLNLERGDTLMAICDLHSLLYIPKGSSTHRRSIEFYHKSLQDYLSNPSRSGELYRYHYRTSLKLAELCSNHAHLRLAGPPMDPISWTAKLSSLAWVEYTTRVMQTQKPDAQLPDAILQFHPGTLLQYMLSIDGVGANASSELSKLGRLRKVTHKRWCNPRRGCLKLCSRLGYILGHAAEIKKLFTTASHFENSRVQALPELNTYVFEEVLDQPGTTHYLPYVHFTGTFGPRTITRSSRPPQRGFTKSVAAEPQVVHTTVIDSTTHDLQGDNPSSKRFNLPSSQTQVADTRARSKSSTSIETEDSVISNKGGGSSGGRSFFQKWRRWRRV